MTDGSEVNVMSVGLKCARCGSSLRADAPRGHCPVCLLALGLSTASAGVIGTLSKNLAAPASKELPAQFFGDYELIEELARGGMGVVYRARQLSLNRPVALKMILDGPLASRGFIERFHIEAEAAAKLNHPNIVPIYEIGEHEGRHFFSMELFQGGDLRARMTDFALPDCQPGTVPSVRHSRARLRKCQQQIALLLATVARGVHHAHERGILHRDLKPGNILLDDHEQPHVTDFGLAKLVADESFLTQSGTILGTPAYMAPEQASSEPAQLTTAADVYSLGAILYHLLTGQPPFQAATALETMRQVLECEPVPPNRLNASIDRDLGTICLKCLSKEPPRRYASALALAEDLESWAKGDTIVARPATRAESVARWCRRKPALAGLTAAVLLLLLAVLVISTIAFVRVEGARQKALSAEQKVRIELRQSYLDQARARRWSGRAGRRFESLRAITNAAAIRRSVELRNEAIADLALFDLHPIDAPQTKRRTDRIAIDFSHDRYLLAEAEGSTTLRRLADGAELFVLPTQPSKIDFATFSSDGNRILFNYVDGSCRVWGVKQRRFVWEHAGVLESAALSVDGRHLAFSTTNAQLVIEPLAAPDRSTTIALPTVIGGLCWNPDGNSLAGIGEKQLLVIDRKAGALNGRFPFARQPIVMAWHPDGKRLAEGGDEQVIHILDVPAGKEIATLEGHLGDVTALRFNPDGTLLASDSWDGTLRLWDFARLKNILTLSAGPEGIEFSPDGRRLSVYSWFGSRIDLFEVLTNGVNAELALPTSTQRAHSGCALVFGNTGDWLAVSEDSSLALWSVSGQPLARWENCPSDALQSLPAGSGLFGWTPEGFYRLLIPPIKDWRARARLERFIPEVPPLLREKCPPEFSTKFRPERLPERSGSSLDGRVVAFAFKDRCYIVDMAAGALRAITASQPWMKFVSVSRNGEWVATGGWHNPNVRIWNAATGEQAAELPTETMANVAFSPDGRWLVTSTGGEYRFWHTGDWRAAHRIERPVNGDLPGPMAFSRDGKLLAVADTTRNVHLVSPGTGELLAEIEPTPDNEIIALAFNPDASELALTRVGAPPEIWHLARIRTELAAFGLDW